MSLEIWLLYVATVLALMSTPGPSHLLMLTNSMNHGFKRSLATGAGDLSANTLQMLAAGLGLGALVAASAHALTVIKWAGVCYLVWMGVRLWLNAGGRKQMAGAKEAALKTLWMQGFFTSLSNPKAVVFFAALFPQFISPNLPFAPQFLILSITYLVIDGTFLSGYGAAAGWMGRKLKGGRKALLDRLSGTFLIVAAMLLGLKSIEDVG